MENINNILSNNILSLRKERGMTQGDLAEKMGVSFQAVSKWENAQASPDIALLPDLADLFGCSIDRLFSREEQVPTVPTPAAPGLPWEDDGVIRGVVYEGRRMLEAGPMLQKFTFEISGEPRDVSCGCNLTVQGYVEGGDCSAGGNLTVGEYVEGNCSAGCNLTVQGYVERGDCSAGSSLSVGEYVEGDCSAGGNLTVGDYVEGDCSVGGNLTVSGYIEGDVTVTGTLYH